MGTVVIPTRELGAVFTKRWMVEFMLDLCEYTPDRDLSTLVALEPSCGDGAFLLPMVERLSESCRRQSVDIMQAREAIRAYDLQEVHVRTCRENVSRWLQEDGWPTQSADTLAETWVRQGDFLLDVDCTSQADIVIGNPPYIRSESIPPELRREYVKRCETMTEGTDVYVGFFEVGLRSLKPGGILCFICADRWMRNGYGKKLRRLVSRHYDLKAVLEMHGVDAFAQEVAAYPAVTMIRAGQQGGVLFAKAHPSFGAESASRLARWCASPTASHEDRDFSAATLEKWAMNEGHWPVGRPERLKILADLETRFPSLEESAVRVGIGVATGADKVFVVNDPDCVEPDRLLPLVRTKDIHDGQIRWSRTWLVNPWREDGTLVSLDEYPRFAQYLEAHRAALANRHVARKNGDTWYRTIDKVIPWLTDRPKLLFPDMKTHIEPVLDRGGLYPHHNLYWVVSDQWDMEVLGGLLLSKVAEFFVASYAVRMRGDTLRFQAQYLRKIRVPRYEELDDSARAKLKDAFRNRDTEAATEIALQVYGISDIPD
ncbi:MAG: Eco57I restriction-modification methylase domain-containing protein [Coriobacteriia bacterium]